MKSAEMFAGKYVWPHRQAARPVRGGTGMTRLKSRWPRAGHSAGIGPSIGRQAAPAKEEFAGG